MESELHQIATEMRQRYAVDGGKPSPDLIAQHAVDVANSLVRWADRIDPMTEAPENLNREMALALTNCLSLIDDLMPGVRHIALQDYAKLNDVPLTAQAALAKFRSLTGEETRDPITAYYEDRNLSGQSPLTAHR
jgi:hypothetical protein